MKHTSGKWNVTYKENTDTDGNITYKINDGFQFMEEAEANAKLIAAAPDLLAACKDFVFLEKTNMTKKQVKLRIELAKQAIAKAESE